MSDIPTPRTDAVAEGHNEIHIYDTGADVPASFARQLERELAEARKELEKMTVHRYVLGGQFEALRKYNELKEANGQ